MSGCGAKQSIDRLLRNAALPLPANVSPVLDELLSKIQTLTQQMGTLRTEQLDGFQTLQDTYDSMVDRMIGNLLTALDDDGRDAPRLFSLEPVQDGWLTWPLGVVRRKFRLMLWCEHSRLPLSLLRGPGSKAGEYELEISQEWLSTAAPFLKTMFATLAAAAATGPGALAFGAAAITAGLTLDHVKKSLESATKAADSLNTWQEGRGKSLGAAKGLVQEARDTAAPLLALPDIIADGGPGLAGQGALRSVQAFLRERDPSFGNLVRVRNQQRKVLWVSELYAKESEYQ